MTRSIRLGFAVAALALGLALPVAAAPPAQTTITISDLDCPSCAKKVAAKLSEVPGVEKVETDVDSQTAKVTAKATVSPKALWEAVEKAKKTPAKIEGPGGTFTKKPEA